MNTFKAITGLAIAAATLAAGTAQAQTLVDRYSFNDTGATVLDSVGGQNGTLANGATEAGGALVTTGAGGSINTTYAALPNSYVLPAGVVTFMDFFTPAAVQSNFSTTFSFATDTSNYVIGTSNRGGDGKPGVEDKKGGAVGSTNQPGGANQPGKQNLFVITYDGTNSTSSLFINGVLDSTNTKADTSFPGGISPTTGFNGIAGGAPFGDNGLNGTTEEFRIYSGAITAAQVQNIATLGPNSLPGAVPEASSSVALGLMLALGGLVVIARKKSLKA